MTTFDLERAARGWGLIAEGAMEISLAYSAIEPAVAPAVSGGVPTAPTVSAAGAAPSASAAPSFDELPPEDVPTAYLRDANETSRAQPPMKPQVDAGLGKCPIHGTGWTIKAGGMSKANKPYRAFWKCSERDGDAFCDQKPQPIWAQTHPAEAVA